LNFVQLIADRIEKIPVRGQDRTVEIEMDNRLKFIDRLDLAFIVGGLALLRGDVGRELDDPERLAVGADQRIIGAQDPEFPAALAQALELGSLMFPAI